MIVLAATACAWISDLEHQDFVDGDRDGFYSDEFVDGTDCDDQDDDVHPEAAESCNDIDDDCDEWVDEGCEVDGDADTDADADTDTDADGDADSDTDSDSDADPGRRWVGADTVGDAASFTWVGRGAGYRDGYALEWVDDLNGDGKDDVVLAEAGSEGRVRLHTTPFSSDMGVSDADRAWSGGSAFATILAVPGDVTGDGSQDLVVYDATGALLLPGPLPSATTSAGITLTVTGSVLDLDGLADRHGDGQDDLVVSTRPSSGRGAVYVWSSGPTAGAVDQAGLQIAMGSTRAASFGLQVAGCDANGDGIDDLVLGEDGGGSLPGRLWFVDGSTSDGSLSLDDVDSFIERSAADELFGISTRCAGDTDGDGREDVLVGATQDDSGGTSAGAAYLVTGRPSTWPASFDDVHARWLGTAGDYLGIGVHGPGDTDVDGYADVAVPGYAASGGNGQVHVFYGPVSPGVWGAADAADYTLTGGPTDYLGLGTPRRSGDANGDAFPDLLLGANGRQDQHGGASIVLALGWE